MTAIKTYGRFPTLGEVKAYYNRDDFLSFLYVECQRRNIYATFQAQRRGEGVRRELLPKNKDHLRELVNDFIRADVLPVYVNDSDRLGKYDYPSFHASSLIKVDGKPTGFDLVFETDCRGWRRSFEALSGAVRLLDAFEVCYRIKYSGVRSLHLMIPFEALPRRFNGDLVLNQREQIVAKLRAYISAHCHTTHYYWEAGKIDTPEYLRLLYSLNEDNGLVNIPLQLDTLDQFRPSQAHIHNVSVDQLWHADVPADAWHKTQKLLIVAFKNDLKKRTVDVPLDLEVAPKVRSNDVDISKWSQRLAETDESDRVEGAWHLLTGSNPVPVETVKAYLTDANPDVRWYLTEALQKHVEPQTIELASRMLCDTDEFVRISAADTLILAGKTQLPYVWRAIINHLDRLTNDMRSDMMYAVEKMPGAIGNR